MKSLDIYILGDLYIYIFIFVRNVCVSCFY